ENVRATRTPERIPQDPARVAVMRASAIVEAVTKTLEPASPDRKEERVSQASNAVAQRMARLNDAFARDDAPAPPPPEETAAETDPALDPEPSAAAPREATAVFGA